MKYTHRFRRGGILGHLPEAPGADDLGRTIREVPGQQQGSAIARGRLWCRAALDYSPSVVNRQRWDEVNAVLKSFEAFLGYPADFVRAPSWLAPGARVKKVGSWPRVGLLDGTEGTVVSLDVLDGRLRWFTVKWDDHTDYTRGVDHYGWHVRGNVVPAGDNQPSEPKGAA